MRPEDPLLANVVKKFEDVLAYVGRDYVDDTDLQTLSETSMGNLLKQLDPYSAYLTTKEVELNNTVLQGELEDVGIELIELHDVVRVIAPMSGALQNK